MVAATGTTLSAEEQHRRELFLRSQKTKPPATRYQQPAPIPRRSNTASNPARRIHPDRLTPPAREPVRIAGQNTRRAVNAQNTKPVTRHPAYHPPGTRRTLTRQVPQSESANMPGRTQRNHAPPRISKPPTDKTIASRALVINRQIKPPVENIKAGPAPLPAHKKLPGKQLSKPPSSNPPPPAGKPNLSARASAKPQPQQQTVTAKPPTPRKVSPAKLPKPPPPITGNPGLPSPAEKTPLRTGSVIPASRPVAAAKPGDNAAPAAKQEPVTAKGNPPTPPQHTAASPPVQTPPPEINPPAIITGDLVSLDPVKKDTIAAPPNGETSPRLPPPPSLLTIPRQAAGKTPKASLSGKATQLAASLTQGADTLGLSVDDVLDLTRTADNLPFIKHEPPGASAGSANDLIISAIKQTDFDIDSSRMEFSGDVQIKSPRFAMRCDRFIVNLKTDGSGISYGEGIGNVFIRMRNEGKPSGHEGFARRAIYRPGEGKLTLSGWPKIREQHKEHVAATEETKMVLYTDGRVKTLGRNRTIISN
jgi:lipopolysaccharide export system protein LptA